MAITGFQSLKAKISKLENTIAKSSELILKYELWMIKRYYYVNHNVAKKIVPAQQILAALEERLSEIKSAPNGFLFGFTKRRLINKEVCLNGSAVKVLVFCQSSHSLPHTLSLEECYHILNEIFSSLEIDLKRIERKRDPKFYLEEEQRSA